MPIESIPVIQLALFGLGWAIGAQLIPEERRVLGHWSAYCLLQALSGLVALPELARGVPPHPVALALSLLGFAVAIRGVALFVHSGARLDRWLAAPVVIALIGILAALPVFGSGHGSWAVIVLCYDLGTALVLLGPMPVLWRGLGGRRLARVIVLVPTTLIGVQAVAAAVISQTLNPETLLIVRESARMPNVVASVVFSTLFNLGYLFLLMSRLIGRLRHGADHDYLTQTLNRRKLQGELDVAWQLYQRTAQPLAVALIDIDHFKRVNDRYGHGAGDQVLVATAHLLRAHIRPYDLVGRWGGEEFIIVLPGMDLSAAAQTGDRLRLAFSELRVGEAGVHLTASIGVAIAEPVDLSVADLVARADRALYQAKNEGRDRVCALAQAPVSLSSVA